MAATNILFSPLGQGRGCALRQGGSHALSLLFCIFTFLPLSAQTDRAFDTELVNDEYNISLRINLYDHNLTVKGQEMLGEVDGYMILKDSYSKWFVVASELKKADTAVLDIINDYGSEDLTAELHRNADGTYTYKKIEGSTLKFAVRGKWQKLPAKIEFKVKR